MDGSNGEPQVARINPGAFNRAGVGTEAGEVEIRLSPYGNWMVHIRKAGSPEWRIACAGDMESGVLVTEPQSEAQDQMIFGPLTIWRAARRVIVGEDEVVLSRKEFALLLVLAGDPYRVFTKEELMKMVWGWFGGRTRTLESHAVRLRAKLAAAGVADLVVNERGVGYRLCPQVPPSPRTTTRHLAGVSGHAPAA
jgi:DNA-binding winged helix-turn-helix (wHTH) protein